MTFDVAKAPKRATLCGGFGTGVTLGSFELGNAFPKDSFQVDKGTGILAGVGGLFNLPKDDAERFDGVALRSKSHRTCIPLPDLEVGMHEAGQKRPRHREWMLGTCRVAKWIKHELRMKPLAIRDCTRSVTPKPCFTWSRRGMYALLGMRRNWNTCGLQRM